MPRYQCHTCGNRCFQDEPPGPTDKCGGCDAPDWKLMRYQEAIAVGGEDFEHVDGVYWEGCPHKSVSPNGRCYKCGRVLDKSQ